MRYANAMDIFDGPRFATGEDEEYFATGEYEIGEDEYYASGADDDLTPEEADILLEALSSGGGDGGGGAGAFPRSISSALRRRGFSAPWMRRAPTPVRRAPAPRTPRYYTPRTQRTTPAPMGGFVVRKKDPATARVLLLGFDSGADVAAGAAATVTEQPQDVFSPRRAVIPSTIGPSFVVNDIKIGNISQLSSSGAIPGEMFAPDTTFSDLKFDTAQVSQQIVWSVQNVSGGAVRFRAGMLGYVARL